MTSQEQALIDDLVERIRNTPVADKDVDAERHLQQTLAKVPDALYILTQTVLVQQYGLTQAQAQLQARQEEIDDLKRSQSAAQAAPKSGGSFLSRIFGSDESEAPPPPGATTSGYQPVNASPAQGGGYAAPPVGGQAYGGQVYGAGAQGYAPGYGGPGYGGPAYGGPGYGGPAYGGPGYGGPGYGSPAMGSSMGMGGGGGFLRGALQTAAGVAAGAMVFRGMEDLFSGFGGGGHGIAGGGGESVVNNYYEGGTEHRGSDLSSGDDSSFYNPAHDASRSGGEAGPGHGFGDLGGSDDSQQASSDDFADDGSDSDDDSFGDDDSTGDSGDSGDDNSGDDNY